MMVSNASRKAMNTRTSPTRAARRCILRSTRDRHSKFLLYLCGCGARLGRAHERQGQRAKQLSSFHENGRHHVDMIRRGEHRVPPDGFPDGFKQEVAGPAHRATYDHALRVDEVAQTGDRHSYLSTRIGDGAPAAD